MKNKMISALLVIALVSGGFGAVSAYAAESSGQEESVIEEEPEVEEKDPLDEQDPDITEQSDSGQTCNMQESELPTEPEETEAAPEEEAAVAETVEPSEEIVEGETEELLYGTDPTSEWLSDYSFDVLTDRIRLTAYNGSDTEISVPGSAVVDGDAYNKIEISAGVWPNAVRLSFEQGIVFPVDCEDLFSDMTSLTSLDLSQVDTSDVTNMNSMFSGCTKLVDLNLDGFNTSNVTNISGMFSHCSSITNLNLSNFDTGNVILMTGVFSDCSALRKVNLSSFDTSNVKYMGYMFWRCSSLRSIDLSNFDVSNVENMNYMFSNCESLTNVDFGIFDTSNVTTMERMFSACDNLTELDVSCFNTSSVTNMEGMFAFCSSLTSMDLSSFDTSNVTNISGMFDYCSELTSVNLSSFDTSNVQYIGGLFRNCSSLTEVQISNFDTSEVTNMNFMFTGCSSLVSLDINNFDTSQVREMVEMFRGCENLTSLDLSNFDTAKVQYMSRIFSDCSSLKSIDIRNFKVTGEASNMFSGCTALVKIYAPAGISRWASYPLPGKYEGTDGMEYTILPQSLKAPMWLKNVKSSADILWISSGPEDAAVPADENAAFSVDASGLGLTYQWQYLGKSTSSWKNFVGGTNSALTKKVLKSWNGWKVRCIVSDENGDSMTSNEALITVYDPITITKQPDAVETSAKKDVTFTVVAESFSNEALSYQWQYQGVSSTKWTNFVDGEDSIMIKTVQRNWDGWRVRCLIRDETGHSMASNTALITIAADPIVITEQPVSVEIQAKKSAVFSVRAVSNISEELTYQWQYLGRNSGLWINFVNAEEDTMIKTVASNWNGWKVRCVISDESGNSVTSTPVTITIKADPIVITKQPVSVTAEAKESVTFTVSAASSNNENLSYQWQYHGISSSNWTNFVNATEETINKTVVSSWNGWKVRCVISDESGNTVTSTAVTIEIR